MKDPQVFIVDYASGAGSPVCEVDYTCKLRCQAGLRALKKYPGAKFVLGAGMSEATDGCGPLAGMMRDYLIEHGVPSHDIFSNPLGYNTLSESEAVYAIIKKQGGGKIVCATSSFHVVRVWCIWFFRFGIVPEMYSTKLKVGRSAMFREFLKVPAEIIRAFTRRFVQIPI